MTEIPELVRLLLDPDVKPSMGLRTRAARLLLESAHSPAKRVQESVCRGCGTRLPEQSRGRPREWCPAGPCQSRRKKGRKP